MSNSDVRVNVIPTFNGGPELIEQALSGAMVSAGRNLGDLFGKEFSAAFNASMNTAVTAGVPGAIQGAMDALGAYRNALSTFGGYDELVNKGQSYIDSMKSMKESMNLQKWFANAEIADGKTVGGISKVSLALGVVKKSASGVGPALLGAFGGPIGIAITGIGMAMGALTAIWDQGRKKAEEQQAAVDALSNSFDKNTGAVTENTYSLIADNLKDAIKNMQELGVDFRGIVPAVAEGGDALQGFITELEKIKRDGTTYVDIKGQYTPIPDADARKANDALELLRNEQTNLTQASEDAATMNTALGTSFKNLNVDAEKASDKIGKVFEKLNLQSSQISAIDALGGSFRDNGSIISAETAAGSKNLSALQNTLSAMANAAEGDSAKYASNVVALMASLRKSGVDTSDIMGLVTESLDALGAEDFAVYLDGSQSIAEAKAIIEANIATIESFIQARLAAGDSETDILASRNEVAGLHKLLNNLKATGRGVGSTLSDAFKKTGSAARSATNEMKKLRDAIFDAAKAWLAPDDDKSPAQKLIQQVKDAYKSRAISKSVCDKLVSSINNADKRLQDIVKQREDLATQIEAANSALEAAIDARDSFKKSIIEGFTALADITKFSQASEKIVTEFYEQGGKLYSVQRKVNEHATASEVIESLRNQVEEAARFKEAFSHLQELGLNNTSLQNLMSEFLSSGDSGQVTALLDGGQSAIDEINDLMTQMSDLTGTETAGWAEGLADSMFSAGIATAQGFLDGLKSQDSALKAQYELMAKNLLETIKKQLGIKSPSREMAYLAEMASEGWNTHLNLDPVHPSVTVPNIPETTSQTDRIENDSPIYMDGAGLVGWIRRLANGEAHLVFNETSLNDTIRSY